MSVYLPYATVIVVWSTTPYFLYASTLAFPAELAGGLRMALAALCAHALLWRAGQRLALHRAAWLTWAAMLPGVFGALYLSYLAAQRVPSGIVSVLFGTSPLLSALFARLVGGEDLPAPQRLAAALVALAGLVVIAGAGGDGGTGIDATGLALLAAAVTLFSLSGVLVRRVGGGLDPLAQTTGALWLSLPCYLLAWLLHGAPAPATASADFAAAVAAIVYLALAGSVLGFICYYRVLAAMPASSAALATVITPVFALLLGALANGERLTLPMLGGAALVLAGVAGFLLPGRAVTVADK